MFNRLKEASALVLILAIFNLKKRVIIETNASNYTIGAYLI